MRRSRKYKNDSDSKSTMEDIGENKQKTILNGSQTNFDIFCKFFDEEKLDKNSH